MFRVNGHTFSMTRTEDIKFKKYIDICRRMRYNKDINKRKEDGR